MNIEKMCRCCLTNDGPLLTIYDDDGGTINNKDSLAEMLKQICNVKPEQNDKLPDKACLLCIREINQSYAFKIKCESSDRTLQQLFRSKIEVNLQSPIQILQPGDVIREDECAQNNFENHCDSIKMENNIETEIHKNFVYRNLTTTGEEESISLTSSPISFPSNEIIENDIYIPEITIKEQQESINIPADDFHNSYPPNFITAQEQLSTPEIHIEEKHEIFDSDTDSDCIEFVSEHQKEQLPTYEQSNNVDGDDNVIQNTNILNDENVEYTYENVSSPQWVTEEESFLTLVNEDLNFGNIERLNKKSIEESTYLDRRPNEIRTGSRYQCAICKKEFDQQIEFANHFGTHKKPYFCMVCNDIFHDYESLHLHLLKHSNNTIKRRSNNSKNRKVKHRKERRYACEFCPMKFYAQSILVNHRRLHTGEQPYKCKYCDRTFKQASTRCNHEKTHTGDKRFKCQYCEKSFVQSGTRLMHERLHTGERPFKCKYCPKTFVQLSTSQRHEDVHKKKDKKCIHCNAEFVTPSDLHKHMEIQHTQID